MRSKVCLQLNAQLNLIQYEAWMVNIHDMKHDVNNFRYVFSIS